MVYKIRTRSHDLTNFNHIDQVSRLSDIVENETKTRHFTWIPDNCKILMRYEVTKNAFKSFLLLFSIISNNSQEDCFDQNT